MSYLKAQVRELLTDYGPIGIVWFDGGGSFKQQSERRRAELIHAQEIIDEIHELQPRCLVNNRLGLPADYGTPEQKIPGGRQTNSFEVCMTLNKHWGYNKHDHDWKSPSHVIQNLVDIASKGGNYLLNVGPTAEGVIPPQSVAILQQVGQWMKRNGEAIYGTTASPFDTAPSWGRVTQKGSKLYLHVFDQPPEGKLILDGFNAKAKRAYLLAGKKSLKLEGNESSVAIVLPAEPLDASDTVVVLEIDGNLNVTSTAGL